MRESFLPHRIEVVQIDVREKWRDDAALRASNFGFLKLLVVHDSAFSHFRRSFNTLRSDPLLYELEQFVTGNFVEISLNCYKRRNVTESIRGTRHHSG